MKIRRTFCPIHDTKLYQVVPYNYKQNCEFNSKHLIEIEFMFSESYCHRAIFVFILN